jgi:hypothetical protein
MDEFQLTGEIAGSVAADGWMFIGGIELDPAVVAGRRSILGRNETIAATAAISISMLKANPIGF